MKNLNDSNNQSRKRLKSLVKKYYKHLMSKDQKRVPNLNLGEFSLPAKSLGGTPQKLQSLSHPLKNLNPKNRRWVSLPNQKQSTLNINQTANNWFINTKCFFCKRQRRKYDLAILERSDKFVLYCNDSEQCKLRAEEII